MCFEGDGMPGGGTRQATGGVPPRYGSSGMMPTNPGSTPFPADPLQIFLQSLFNPVARRGAIGSPNPFNRDIIGPPSVRRPQVAGPVGSRYGQGPERQFFTAESPGTAGPGAGLQQFGFPKPLPLDTAADLRNQIAALQKSIARSSGGRSRDPFGGRR